MNLTLSNPGGGATLGPRKTAVLTINDDEPTMQFAALEFIGLEGTPGGVITVTRTGSLTGTATVRYTATDDTATVLRDYTSPTGVVTFPPGVASKTFTVPITDGSVLEQDEFVTLTLSDPTNGLLGNPRVAKLRIRDNDPGTLKFSAATYTVPEKSATGKVTVTVQRTGSLNTTTTVLDLRRRHRRDGAGRGRLPRVSQTVTFLPTETKKDVKITIFDDTLAEGERDLQGEARRAHRQRHGQPAGARRGDRHHRG